MINPSLIKVNLRAFDFYFFKLGSKDLIRLYKEKNDEKDKSKKIKIEDKIELSIKNFEHKLGISIEKSFLFEVIIKVNNLKISKT